MNITIYTTSKDKWYRSRATRIEKAYKPYYPLTFTFVYVDAPKNPVFNIDKDGDKCFNWEWFSKTFPKVDGGVAFHFNKKYARRWGIKLGGQRDSNHKDVPYFWLTADKEGREGYDISNFERILYHESAHFWEDLDNDYGNKLVQDSVHHTDYILKKIHKYHESVNFSLLTEIKKSFIQKQIDTLMALLALQKPKTLQPLVQRQANEILRSMDLLGMPMRITEGYRSIARQNELYAQGRTTKGNIVTQAKGGESLHNYGVAVDFVFLKGYDVPESQWNMFGTVAVSKGFEWGGSWKGFVDKPHVEMRMGYSLKDFQENKVNYNKYK